VTPFYRFAWFICRIFLRTVRRMTVMEVVPVPDRGGLIVVANHTSYWDPVILGCALRRQVFFMAKEELFRIPGLGRVIRWLGAFPVRRGAPDRAAYRTALTLLRQGRAVGIFPEGTRSHTGRLLPPQAGAAVLALRTGVPVVPVYIRGSQGLIGRVSVRVGRPMLFAGREQDPDAVGKAIMEAVEILREEGEELTNGGPGSRQGRFLLRRAAGGGPCPPGRRV
jgi:1-acyl-sn-glycerol-3-phosphate acyltransferase